MKDCFNKFLIYIFLLINIIKCQNSNDYIDCTKLTIYKNGTFENGNINENINKNKTITSIQFNEKFVIYDCMNEKTDNYCTFYNEATLNGSLGLSLTQTCTQKEVTFEDNICCYYRKKVNDNITYGCLEVNKYEIQKFNRVFKNNQFDQWNISYNNSIIEIECNDKINKINKFIIFIFLIIFINL